MDPVVMVSLPGAVQATATCKGAGSSPALAMSVDAQICEEGRGGKDRRESSLEVSEMSMGKMTPLLPGWAKMVRIGTAARCRKPCSSCVTAFEKIVRRYAENPSENVIVPILGASFDSLGEAYDFCNLYSWERGFGIRYKKSRVNVERMKGMQEIVCGCSGKAGVENTRSCRCECHALIRLLRSEDNEWYIVHHRRSTSTLSSQILAEDSLAIPQTH
ncbi:uncharacterized protein [Triticum aestivum]|nr:uncharacterized protein LOC123104273 isoform X2 [Triticum aestivum]